MLGLKTVAMGQAGSLKLSHCSWAWLLLVCWSTGLLVCPSDCLEDTHSLVCNFTVKAHTAPGQSWYEGQCRVEEGSFIKFDAASLCYKFTGGNSGSGPWSYKVQGQLNNEVFLYYNCSNNKCSIGLLGNRLNATKIWENQVECLKDVGDLFKEQLPEMKQKNHTIREPLTLQAKMCCWHEGDGHIHGSWDIGLSGQEMFHIDSDTGEWTEVHPGSSWMKEIWRKNRDVTAFLNRTSLGDCRTWLEEFKSHWEQKLELTASSATTPDVGQPSSTSIRSNPSVLLIILTCPLLLLI